MCFLYTEYLQVYTSSLIGNLVHILENEKDEAI